MLTRGRQRRSCKRAVSRLPRPHYTFLRCKHSLSLCQQVASARSSAILPGRSSTFHPVTFVFGVRSGARRRNMGKTHTPVSWNKQVAWLESVSPASSVVLAEAARHMRRVARHKAANLPFVSTVWLINASSYRRYRCVRDRKLLASLEFDVICSTMSPVMTGELVVQK